VEQLKAALARGTKATFEKSHPQLPLPSVSRGNIFTSTRFGSRPGQMPHFFPTPESEAENQLIWLKVGRKSACSR
jgi:hypothetical protein